MKGSHFGCQSIAVMQIEWTYTLLSAKDVHDRSHIYVNNGETLNQKLFPDKFDHKND